MSFRKLLGEAATKLVADVATGFAEEIAESLHRAGEGTRHDPEAHRLGRSLAAELLADLVPPPISGEVVEEEPLTEREILEQRLAQWGGGVQITPELRLAYQQYEQRRKH